MCVARIYLRGDIAVQQARTTTLAARRATKGPITSRAETFTREQRVALRMIRLILIVFENMAANVVAKPTHNSHGISMQAASDSSMAMGIMLAPIMATPAHIIPKKMG
mmetsp:Transcript_3117/g.4744  ORF Transcript_3117/g.4744 Transcript_3117/m.4744 type:complete len:108 (+) Transcript_3117:639-962(+)